MTTVFSREVLERFKWSRQEREAYLLDGCPICGHRSHYDRPERACDADGCPCQAID